MEDSADMEQGDEAEMPEGEAPLEPPPPAAAFRCRPELYRLHHGFR